MHTIMIVDDEPSIVDVFSMMLERKGHQTIQVHSGEECIEILHALNPDLILLDVRMVPMTGWETLEQIKSNPLTQSIPVIMVTGDQLTPEETMKYGNLIEDYIQKPTTIKELTGHIEAVLQRQEELNKRIEQARKRGADERTVAEIRRLTHNMEVSENLIRVLEKGYRSSDRAPELRDHIRQFSRTVELQRESIEKIVADPGSRSFPMTFISSKSADYEYARILNGFLKQHNIPTFFSDESIDAIGQANYRKIIDTMLEQANHLVVITSRPEHVREGWVEYEWGCFVNLQRSGRKEGGNVVVMTIGNLNPADLPLSLQYNQIIPFNETNLGKLLHYLS
jgi:two-component system OmpR family response regulator